MTIDDVLDELRDAADDLGITAPHFGTSKGKAYEIWVILELVARLRERGLRIEAHDRNDRFEPCFRVSGAPADMPGSGDGGAPGPCHFKIHGRFGWVELHLGLNNRGMSGASHEIDLAIISGLDGLRLRSAGGGPFEGRVEIGLELKAFSAKHKLPHDIPRALLGVAIDLDPAWALAGCSLHSHGGRLRWGWRKDRTQLAVVTATDIYLSSQQYLTFHEARAYARVLPDGNEQAPEDIVDEIEDLVS